MGKSRSRATESIVYIVLWFIAIGLYLLDVIRNRAQMSAPLVDMSVLSALTHTMLPFLILFLVNNNVLIPKLILRNRILPYLFGTVCVISAMWVYQYFDFMHVIESLPRGVRPGHHPHIRPLLPLPLVLDFTYALLVVGCNLAIALMFQRFDDRLEKESLMKANAESQLAYLKNQINPHFYMNMLNNIHGMIEIDPDKAQLMVIDMSQLMRYMLYESSRRMIPLSEEIMFLRNYMSLMRQRFPENKVSVTSEFIKTLIKDKLDDGQLDKSGLAISDLETIRKSFIEVFKGMYHNRVAYPKKEEMDAAKKQKKGEQEENKT